MKKIILILAAAAVMIIGSSAFAHDLDIRNGMPREGHQYSRTAYDNKDQFRDFGAEFREKIDIITKQRAEIKDLRYRLTMQAKQVKARVNSLKRQKAPLDPAKIESIKQALGSIKEAHRLLSSTQDAIQAKNSELKTARQNRRPAAFLQVMDDIIDIQQKRIDALGRILSDVDRLNGNLI